MAAIEDIINIQSLLQIFEELVKKGKVRKILDVIILWSKIEFNYIIEENSPAGNVVDDDEEEKEVNE